MRVVRPLTSLIEHIYAPVATNQAWLAGIHAEASLAFDGHRGAQVYTMRPTLDGVDVDAAVADDSRIANLLVENHRHADAGIANLLRTGPVLRASQVVPPGHPAREFAVNNGFEDIVLATGYADCRGGCVVTFQIPLATPALPRAVRSALARVSAHMAAAYRLRVAGNVEGDGDAVLSTSGVLLHATEDHTAESRERLREAARRIARAKRESKDDPVAGLGFWTAMVEGSWTLVERIDSDGKRHLIARRNEPATRHHHALSRRERIVFERASYGSTLRHIAYELGLADSTVSSTLTRAMRKLGVRDRSELMELRAAIVGTEDIG